MKERDETTYYNDKGYPCYKDSHALCHIKTAKKKYGEDYSKTNHIHHLDGNKDNYRHDNLVMVHPKDHELLERRIKNIKTALQINVMIALFLLWASFYDIDDRGIGFIAIIILGFNGLLYWKIGIFNFQGSKLLTGANK